MSNIDSKNTKYEISEALIGLIREARNYSEINISSVAFKANMHRNTIYYHFRDMKELLLWTVHYELNKAMTSREYFDVRDGMAVFFTRMRPLLLFAKQEMGTEEYLRNLRFEILPLVEPLTEGPAINSEEAKKIAVDTFVEQIVVASLIHEKPADMIRLIFTSIMPEVLRRPLI